MKMNQQDVSPSPNRLALCVLSLAAVLVASGAGITQQVDVYARPAQIEPSHDFDVQHYRVTLEFDLEAKTFHGENEITLTPLRDEWVHCRLDALHLQVNSVVDAQGKKLSFHQEAGDLHVNFSRAHDFGEEVQFTIAYQGSDPESGLYFDEETADHPMMVSTDSFPNNARRWIPCYDYPHDKVTQELIVTAPLGNKILSNGRLISSEEDEAAGTTTWHWHQQQPHSTYLFMLAIGPFVVIEDQYGNIPVNYWVYPKDAKDAEWIFAKTPHMIDFYSKLFDYPYPWAKYDQVTTPHVGGGAEATSATVLGQRVIHNRRAEQDFSWEWILAHEVAHHWWGDLITLREWSHTWLNESFATYSDYLYTNNERGADEGAWDLKGKKEQYLREAHNRYMRPIVFDRYEHPGQNFDSHTYPKGAAVLHMLRFVLGDDPFFASLSQFLKTHAFQPVDTHDFMNTVKDATGQNVDWFFAQFIFKPGHMALDVESTWDQDRGLLQLKVAQVQDRSKGVPIYRVPVEVGIVTEKGKAVERVWLEKAEDSFEFRLENRPLLVRFDEGNRLLKEWTYPKEVAELIYQAKNDDVIGREWAIRQLASSVDDPAVVECAVSRANNDHFWAVRKAAVDVLHGSGQQGHWDLFRAKVTDTNSKVRVSALRALASSMDRTHLPLFRLRFKQDDSYIAQAEALRAIGRLGGPDDLALLQEAAALASPNGVLKRAASQAMAEIQNR